MPAVILDRVAKLYGRAAALRAVSLQLESGQTLVLLGPNGSGKTTLLKILAGAIAPTIGKGTIFGHNMVDDRISLRREVGLLASETYLYDDLTARENLRFIATMAGFRISSEDVSRILASVDLLRQGELRARNFSSGMKRRLALARLLLLDPRLVLLDEPYNSLDVEGAALINELIRDSAGRGKVTVLATHDAERGLALADLVAVLERGRMTYFGAVPGYRARSASGVV